MVKLVEITEEQLVEFTGMKERMDRMEEALLRGVGVDPKIAAREALPYVKVQFTRHYNRASVPSDIQKGALIIAGFSVSAGDIVRIRKDEFMRITKEFPGLMESQKDKWVEKPNFRPVQRQNKDSGRMEWIQEAQPIDVKTLVERSEDYKVG